jgi:hypothetical protein
VHIQSGFEAAVVEMAAIVDENSRSFLEEEEREARNRLCSIALNDADMNEGLKRVIANLILDFPTLETSGIADVKFDIDDYEWSFRVLFFDLGKSGELDYQKLATDYNDNIRSTFKRIVELARDSHKPKFATWLNELCTSTSNNIANYNPELRDIQRNIDTIDNRLRQLTASLEALDACSHDISKLIGWRVRLRA